MNPIHVALDAVDRIGVPWMLGGSLGAMCYSEPRSTLDADCVLQIAAGQERLVQAAFPETEFYSPPRDTLIHEVRRGSRGSWNAIHYDSGFKIDLYPCGDDHLMRWGLAGRRQMRVDGRVTPVAPPEYIVVMKLRYFAMSGQEKHLRDIRSLLRFQPEIDRVIIQSWAERYGVLSAWHVAQL